MNVPAKISRPRLSAVVQRARLLELLEASREAGSATFISGPPGSGKTTLTSSYIELRNLRCIWYQVDQGDEDLPTFFHFLTRAAQSVTLERTALLPQYDGQTSLIRFSQVFFRQLYDGLRTPFVIVFDGYQALVQNSPVHEVLRVACEEMPAGGHMIMMSRGRRPTQFARLQLRRSLTSIGTEALILEPEESFEIARLRGHLLRPDQALHLHERSHGWVTGLIILLEGDRNSGGRQLVDELDPEELLSHYFRSEVFEPLGTHHQLILLKCALLPTITCRDAETLTGMSDAGQLLRRLANFNFFVTRHGQEAESYRFHPLFRSFLQREARARFSEEEYADLCVCAAQVLGNCGELESAVDLLADAKDWPETERLICRLAPPMHADGRHRALQAQLTRIPFEYVSNSPWLLYWLGVSRYRLLQGDGQDEIERAYHRFIQDDDADGVAASWCAAVRATCHFGRTLHHLDRWIEAFDLQVRTYHARLDAARQQEVALAYFTAIVLRQPNHPDLEYWYEKLRAMLDAVNPDVDLRALSHALVLHHVLRGELVHAELLLSLYQWEANLEPVRQDRLTQQLCRALVALHTGAERDCRLAVAAGLETAHQAKPQRYVGGLLCCGALMSLNRGELSKADEYLQAFKRLTLPEQANLLPFFSAASAWQKYHRGETVLAVQFAREANRNALAQGVPYVIAAALLGTGLLLYLTGHAADGAVQIEEGGRAGEEIRNDLIGWAYLIFSAYVASDTEDTERADALIARAMELGRRNGFLHFLFFPQKVIAQICCRALEAGVETEYVRTLIAHNKLQPSTARPQTESWPWPLRIYTLGRFSIVRNGSPLQSRGKAQKKPLELLRALLAFGGRDVPESRIADALWPDSEGDAALQTLATTLFRLRKLIGEQSIRRQENKLTLDPSLVWVDCWAFERMFNERPISASNLAKMKKLYQGAFLAGAETAPWILPMRERLHAHFIQLSRVPDDEGTARAA